MLLALRSWLLQIQVQTSLLLVLRTLLLPAVLHVLVCQADHLFLLLDILVALLGLWCLIFDHLRPVCCCFCWRGTLPTSHLRLRVRFIPSAGGARSL